MRRPLHRGPQRTLMIDHAISTKRLVITIIAGLTTVVGSSAVAWNGDVPGWEAAILRFFNRWPAWLEPMMWVLQQPGVILAPVVAGLVVVWFTRRWQHFVAFACVLPLKLGIEKGVVKQLVRRERPYVSIGPEINVRGPAFEGLSFPSGHTTTAFALAMLTAAFLPLRWRPLPVAWAAIVGIARLYYGEHNALDVVAGAAMGTMFATILWFAFLNRFAHPDRDLDHP